MKAKYFLIGLFLSLNTLTFSQVMYHTDDYVVTMKGDTIKGQLENLGVEKAALKLSFMIQVGRESSLKQQMFMHIRGVEMYIIRKAMNGR